MNAGLGGDGVYLVFMRRSGPVRGVYMTASECSRPRSNLDLKLNAGGCARSIESLSFHVTIFAMPAAITWMHHSLLCVVSGNIGLALLAISPTEQWVQHKKQVLQSGITHAACRQLACLSHFFPKKILAVVDCQRCNREFLVRPIIQPVDATVGS